MPLAKVNISDDLIVDFDKSPKNTKFCIKLTNKGKRTIRLKRIGSYSKYIHVVDFDENDNIIVSGGQKEYSFEAEYSPQIVSSEETIRFSFNNRTHVTRTIKIVHTPKDSIPNGTSHKSSAESLPNSMDKKVFTRLEEIERIMKKRAQSNESNDNEGERTRSYTPGIFRVELPHGEDLLKDFRRNALVDITECLTVEFDGFERSRMLQVSIRNRSRNKLVRLSLIEINHSSVKLSKKSGHVADAKAIPVQGVRKLEFEVAFVSGIASSKALLKFHFDNDMIIRRSIQIHYRPSAPNFQKNQYDVPATLIHLISKQKIISYSNLMKSLDEIVPTVDDNYRKHFHNVLYLEEAGMRQDIIDKYSQKEAFFGDTDYTRVNSKDVRRKYKTGHYDLKVHDLYETRPSLQLGMILSYSMHIMAKQ